MDERFKEICKRSLKLFLEYGIKNVNMDDISRHMHMSKKTLYQYVDSKEDLLHKIMDGIKKAHQQSVPDAWKKKYNAIEILFIASKKIYEFQTGVKKPFRFDMEKFYPEMWQDFRNEMRKKSYRYFSQNIEQGIQEGLYRKDVDADMIATLYYAKIDGVHRDFARDPEKYTYRQLFEALFEQHIRAIATEKGIAYLEEKKSHFKIQSSTDDY